MTAPEQLRPPVYGCAAGTVLHAHAAHTLEPGVLLYTFLPPGLHDSLREVEPRVDVHADGPSATTLTVRALVGDYALSWQLPLAPFVAALPGQSGDEGRMVLLALVDAEPSGDFWTQPVDCEHLAAELQLPVSELAEALRGRLTPWLDEDLRLLLDDDAYHRAADRSPAQTLADAVVATYRGDIEAERALTRLMRALSMAPAEHSSELGVRLCNTLITAFDGVEPEALAEIAAQSGPFETEVLRLLTELPPLLITTPVADHVDATLALLMSGGDVDETVRGTLTLISRLVRTTDGPDLSDDALLRRLLTVDDRGLVRLAELWVRLCVAAAAPAAQDLAAVGALREALTAEGRLGTQWLRETLARLAQLTRELPARSAGRVQAALAASDAFTAVDPADPGDPDAALQAALDLARHVRARGGGGPDAWLVGPAAAAVPAVLAAHHNGLDLDTTVDLITHLLPEDVEGADLLDGLVCATAQLLGGIDPAGQDELRAQQVRTMLGALPSGPRGSRWLLASCLVEAPRHDAGVADLSPHVPATDIVDADRFADRLGVPLMVKSGLAVLSALADELGDEAHASRLDVFVAIFASALLEHGLIREAP